MEIHGPGAGAAAGPAAGAALSAGPDSLAGERRRLFGLAYRMLGSAGEAEDAVQEAYLRWYSQPREQVQCPPAFLTTVVTRLCLDRLKSARHRREQYPGVWLPEPLPHEGGLLAEPAHGADPQENLQRLESVSLAFLWLLEALSPLERAVYLLAEVFDYPHAEIADMLERTPQACRQALRRARQSLAHGRRAAASAERHRELLASFLAACRRGDIDQLTQLLADDVVSRADGGGVTAAANRPVHGLRAVSRLYTGLARQMPDGLAVRIETVNGWPAALLVCGPLLLSVVQVRVVGGRIDRIDNLLNPEKLWRLAAAFGLCTASQRAGAGRAGAAEPAAPVRPAG